MNVYCKCEGGPGVMVGSPVNPCYVVEYMGELVMLHYLCTSDEMKAKLGCPCDCHLTVNEEGENILASCSFCPVKHEE